MEIKNTTDISLDVSMNLVRYKIVFVGDVSVGKTSIINRLMDNKFNETYDVNIKIIKCLNFFLIFKKILIAFNWSRFFFKNSKIQG
jgi:GTPase SAR1 family protein